MATAKKAAAKKAPAQEIAVAAPVAAPVVEAPAAEVKKPNAAFMKPMTPSKLLAAVVGKGTMPRTEVTKKVWEYIKKHDLQDSANRRNINADDKLQPIFKKPQVSMFEMTKLINEHLS